MLTLRKADVADIPLIRDLTREIWPVTYGTILTPAQIDYMIARMYDAGVLQQQMESEQDFVIVYDGKEPIGFAAYGLIEPQVFKLHKIYILPAQKGKGTGKFVITQVADAVRAKNAIALRLNVNRSNKAVGFYQKLGFEIIREEDIDIGSGYFMNDFVMELKLR